MSYVIIVIWRKNLMSKKKIQICSDSSCDLGTALCERYDVIVIADEIHQDFEFSAHPFKSVLSIEEERFHNRLIVCNAPSKSFNLASLLHSHIIIPDQELREQFDQKMIRYQQTEVNLLGQVAGEAAYRGGEEWFDSLLTVIRSNDLLVREALAEFPQLIVSDLEGTYLLWIDLRAIIPRDKVKDIVYNTMTNIYNLEVPLDVHIEIGNNWYEAK